MNKKRRQELEKLKFLRRLRIYSLTKEYEKRDGFNCYRAQSVPCSCFCCQKSDKYKRSDFKRETRILLAEIKISEESKQIGSIGKFEAS